MFKLYVQVNRELGPWWQKQEDEGCVDSFLGDPLGQSCPAPVILHTRKCELRDIPVAACVTGRAEVSCP